ncbi:hypothetical protein SNEBB_009856 [Seison nebaliae]|nr:hypothetical protein SNEBB_009856 [Seison nebaliae]
MKSKNFVSFLFLLLLHHIYCADILLLDIYDVHIVENGYSQSILFNLNQLVKEKAVGKLNSYHSIRQEEIRNLRRIIHDDYTPTNIKFFSIKSKYSNNLFKVDGENGDISGDNSIDRESLCSSNICRTATNGNARKEQKYLPSSSAIQPTRMIRKDVNGNEHFYTDLNQYKKLSKSYYCGECFIHYQYEIIYMNRIESNNHRIYNRQRINRITVRGQIHITIDDIDDNISKFPFDSIEFQIPENVPVGTRYRLFPAIDLDANNLREKNRYQLKNISPPHCLLGELFELDENNHQSLSNDRIHYNQLEMKLMRSLDRERCDRHTLLLKSRDEAQQMITITVMDINDNMPKVKGRGDTHNLFYAKISENSCVDDYVGMIRADDLDEGKNKLINFTIFWNESFPFFSLPPSGAPFFIELHTGIIRIKQKSNENRCQILDRERTANYKLVISLRDNGLENWPQKAYINIDVTDINDNTPEVSILFFPKPSFVFEEYDLGEKSSTKDVTSGSQLTNGGKDGNLLKFSRHLSQPNLSINNENFIYEAYTLHLSESIEIDSKLAELVVRDADAGENGTISIELFETTSIEWPSAEIQTYFEKSMNIHSNFFQIPKNHQYRSTDHFELQSGSASTHYFIDKSNDDTSMNDWNEHEEMMKESLDGKKLSTDNERILSLILRRELDYEENRYYRLIISINDNGQTIRNIRRLVFYIEVGNMNDNVPELIQPKIDYFTHLNLTTSLIGSKKVKEMNKMIEQLVIPTINVSLTENISPLNGSYYGMEFLHLKFNDKDNKYENSMKSLTIELDIDESERLTEHNNLLQPFGCSYRLLHRIKNFYRSTHFNNSHSVLSDMYKEIIERFHIQHSDNVTSEDMKFYLKLLLYQQYQLSQTSSDDNESKKLLNDLYKLDNINLASLFNFKLRKNGVSLYLMKKLNSEQCRHFVLLLKLKDNGYPVKLDEYEKNPSNSYFNSQKPSYYYTPDGHVTLVRVNLFIKDLNDNQPKFISDEKNKNQENFQSFEIDEEPLEGEIFGNLRLIDLDVSEKYSKMHFQIVPLMNEENEKKTIENYHIRQRQLKSINYRYRRNILHECGYLSNPQQLFRVVTSKMKNFYEIHKLQYSPQYDKIELKYGKKENFRVYRRTLLDREEIMRFYGSSCLLFGIEIKDMENKIQFRMTIRLNVRDLNDNRPTLPEYNALFQNCIVMDLDEIKKTRFLSGYSSIKTFSLAVKDKDKINKKFQYKHILQHIPDLLLGYQNERFIRNKPITTFYSNIPENVRAQYPMVVPSHTNELLQNYLNSLQFLWISEKSSEKVFHFLSKLFKIDEMDSLLLVKSLELEKVLEAQRVFYFLRHIFNERELESSQTQYQFKMINKEELQKKIHLYNERKKRKLINFRSFPLTTKIINEMLSGSDIVNSMLLPILSGDKGDLTINNINQYPWFYSVATNSLHLTIYIQIMDENETDGNFRNYVESPLDYYELYKNIKSMNQKQLRRSKRSNSNNNLSIAHGIVPLHFVVKDNYSNKQQINNLEELLKLKRIEQLQELNQLKLETENKRKNVEYDTFLKRRLIPEKNVPKNQLSLLEQLIEQTESHRNTPKMVGIFGRIKMFFHRIRNLFNSDRTHRQTENEKKETTIILILLCIFTLILLIIISVLIYCCIICRKRRHLNKYYKYCSCCCQKRILKDSSKFCSLHKKQTKKLLNENCFHKKKLSINQHHHHQSLNNSNENSKKFNNSSEEDSSQPVSYSICTSSLSSSLSKQEINRLQNINESEIHYCDIDKKRKPLMKLDEETVNNRYPTQQLELEKERLLPNSCSRLKQFDEFTFEPSEYGKLSQDYDNHPTNYVVDHNIYTSCRHCDQNDEYLKKDKSYSQDFLINQPHHHHHQSMNNYGQTSINYQTLPHSQLLSNPDNYFNNNNTMNYGNNISNNCSSSSYGIANRKNNDSLMNSRRTVDSGLCTPYVTNQQQQQLQQQHRKIIDENLSINIPANDRKTFDEKKYQFDESSDNFVVSNRIIRPVQSVTQFTAPNTQLMRLGKSEMSNDTQSPASNDSALTSSDQVLLAVDESSSDRQSKHISFAKNQEKNTRFVSNDITSCSGSSNNSGSGTDNQTNNFIDNSLDSSTQMTWNADNQYRKKTKIIDPLTSFSSRSTSNTRSTMDQIKRSLTPCSSISNLSTDSRTSPPPFPKTNISPNSFEPSTIHFQQVHHFENTSLQKKPEKLLDFSNNRHYPTAFLNHTISNKNKFPISILKNGRQIPNKSQRNVKRNLSASSSSSLSLSSPPTTAQNSDFASKEFTTHNWNSSGAV